MFYETPHRDKARLPHDPFKAIVAPRPIGWISTRALDGRINLAPYSFFNGFCSAPPIVSTLPLQEPERVRISTISTTLHSSEAGLSATRGAATMRHPAIVNPAWSNSFAPRGSGADVAFIGSRRSRVARLATNSPLSLAKVAECSSAPPCS